MGSQRVFIRIAGLLIGVHLFTLIGLLGAARCSPLSIWTQVPANHAAARQAADQTGSGQAPGLNGHDSRDPHHLQWQRSALIFWDLFEEESQNSMSALHKTAPHILFSLSSLYPGVSTMMQPAGWLPKIYLLNSALRC